MPGAPVYRSSSFVSLTHTLLEPAIQKRFLRLFLNLALADLHGGFFNFYDVCQWNATVPLLRHYGEVKNRQWRIKVSEKRELYYCMETIYLGGDDGHYVRSIGFDDGDQVDIRGKAFDLFLQIAPYLKSVLYRQNSSLLLKKLQHPDYFGALFGSRR